MFIRTDSGYVNVNQVVSIDDDGQGTRVELLDGSKRVTRDTALDILHLSSPVIPATPGYQLVWFAPDKSEDLETRELAGRINRDDIIAWRIPPRPADPSPVTIDGSGPESLERAFDNDLFWAILCPNGRVVCSDHGDFSSLEDWFSHLHHVWTDRRRKDAMGAER